MKGMMVVITSPDGKVQAAEADFQQHEDKVTRRKDAQVSRSRVKAWGKIMDKQCTPAIAKVIKCHDQVLRTIQYNLQEIGWREQIKVLEIEVPIMGE